MRIFKKFLNELENLFYDEMNETKKVKIKLAIVVEGDQKGPLFNSYYTEV